MKSAIALVALLFLGGCKSIGGHYLPAWYNQPTSVWCNVEKKVESEQSLSRVRVTVADESYYRLPGAFVLARPQGVGDANATNLTDLNGETSVLVRPGVWVFETTLSGFESARVAVAVEAGSTCEVVFALRYTRTE